MTQVHGVPAGQAPTHWTGAESLAVHDRFAEQVRATPDAVAVSAGSREISYAELEARANRLAHRLRALGVGLETPVGICLERSATVVVALLAVLKAGGHYVALEPEHPAQHTAAILRDVQAGWVLTSRALARRLPDDVAALRLDELEREARDCPATAPEAMVTAATTAYIAYTSGSTGKAKGVAVPHHAVLRLVQPSEFLTMTSGDAMLQLAPLAFDASTLELWAPLLNGARVAVHPPGDVTPTTIRETVSGQRVTALWLTAGLFHQVAERAGEGFDGVRVLLAGGDVLSVSHVNRMLTAHPGLQVVNGYGPTENTTFTCCHVMTEPVGTDFVPIGRPVPETEVRLLDEALQPVPAGEVGEIYAAGRGVANGYLRQPALTAAHFLPDPAGRHPGARMYRTGDLGRLLPDGAVQFLGRVDNQIKIRGYRVEPGEIETVLRGHPAVLDSSVVPQEEPSGRRLAAFVVGTHQIELPDLRQYLARSLPGHSLPSVYFQLDRLPLTPNGKVDRALLATRRSHSRPDSDVEYQPPATDLERWLTELWGDLMAVEGIGIDDDFFELGGHSLMATAITERIATVHEVKVSPRNFYENPTIAELAGLIERLTGGHPRRAIDVGRSPADEPAPPDEAATEASTADILRQIFAAELGEEVAAEDDFYAMGGDSLIALRVAAEAVNRGLSVRLIDLLTYPSAAELAAYLIAKEPPSPARETPTGPGAAPAPEEFTVSPASALQVGMIYLCETTGDPALYNDLIGMRVRVAFDERCFRAALRRLADRHPALRTSLDLATYDDSMQVIWPTAEIPLDVQWPGGEDETSADALVARWRTHQLANQFDWERAPLVRCHVVALAESFRLTVAIHHAIMDGWSFARLLVDLLTLYDAEVNDRDAELPPVPEHGHARFVEAEKATVAVPGAAAFWRAQADVPPLLLDRARFSGPANPEGYAALRIEPALLAALRRSAALAQVPLKSLLIAVHCRALGQWTRREGDVVTGLVMNGRPEVPGADLLVGLFLNTVPLRVGPVSADPAELARAALAGERAAMPHRRFPLALIEQDLGRRAYDVVFNFTDFHVYDDLAALGTVRVDGWWSADKASDPVTCDYTINFPGFGTGVTVAYDRDIVRPDRIEELLTCIESSLHLAAQPGRAELG